MDEYVLLNNKRIAISTNDFLNMDNAILFYQNYAVRNRNLETEKLNAGFYILKCIEKDKENLLYIKDNATIINLGSIFTEKQRTESIFFCEFIRKQIRKIYFEKMKKAGIHCVKESDFENYIRLVSDNDIYINYDLLHNGEDMYNSIAIREQVELYLYEWQRIYNHMQQSYLLLSDIERWEKNIKQTLDFVTIQNYRVRITHDSGITKGFVKEYNEKNVFLDSASISIEKIESIERWGSEYKTEYQEWLGVIQAKHYI